MTDKNLQALAEQEQARARKVVDRAGVYEAWESVGATVNLVGSLRNGLLIKHRDDWAGPIDIAEFAPLSVKTPDADFVDILAADNPAVWTTNPPAKTGDTRVSSK